MNKEKYTMFYGFQDVDFSPTFNISEIGVSLTFNDVLVLFYSLTGSVLHFFVVHKLMAHLATGEV